MIRRWLKRVALFALAAVSLTLVSAYLVVWRSVPALTGEARVRGNAGPIEVLRDAHAVPHIYAQSAADAYFALGYVHAQDRLWQMELSRRVGSGTLAELLGERALEVDRLFRTLDLRAAAEGSLAHLDDETRGMLSAYTAGVNAWIGSGEGGPIEFTVLRHEPAPWSDVDSVVVNKLMAWQLSGNFYNELRRLRLAAILSPAQLEQFVGDEHPELPIAPLLAVYEQLGLHVDQRGAQRDRALSSELGRLASALSAFAPSELGRAIGSNNWAVSGAHTQSKLPLLANDPHLELSVPSQWYFAHLEAPGLKVIGATIPAMPGVVLGRNAEVAWAFTNMAPDTQDLYFEKTTEGGYLTPSGPRDFMRAEVTIAVRGSEPVNLTVRKTRHGPVISDVSRDAKEALPSGHVLALAWTGLATDDETLAFAIHAAKARDAQELRTAARHFHGPAQNIVYADRHGTIAYLGAGKIPLRSAKNTLRGLMPAAGWDSAYDWTGFVPFDELPQWQDPPSGVLVTANQNMLPPDYPHWIGVDFALPLRAQRIADLLSTRPIHTPQSFVDLQADQASGEAQVLLVPMLDALRDHATGEALLDELRAWDGTMRADARPPLVFAAFLRELIRAIAADELGAAFAGEWEMRPGFLAGVLRAENGLDAWCDDTGSTATERCPQIARAAWTAALAYLDRRFGSDRDQWRWGKAHRSHAAHRLFGALPLLSEVFNLIAERGGDSTSVNVGSFVWDDPELAFANDWGPSFRAVYDLADLDASRGILNSGQSGHVLSAHYRDMHGPWARGELVPLSTREHELRAGALGSLWLRPAAPRSEVQ